MSVLVENEALLRLMIFGSIFLIMALLELFRPLRSSVMSKPVRWKTNLSITILDVLLVRLIMPMLPVGAALWAQENGFGLLNMGTPNDFVSMIVTILVLDLIIYTQHVIFHKVPFFWRFHKVHHTDLDFDVSTGFRFHPVEIIFSLFIKMTFVLLIGANPAGVVLFEIILSATSLFNHSNVKLPNTLERWMRYFVVTPDMHRVHHSTLNLETDSNFGFNLPYWDRLFKTYCPQPKEGHLKMTIGLSQYQNPQKLTFSSILFIPFK